MNTPQITPTPDAVKLAGELAERILPYTAVARADMVHEIDQLRADATALILPVLTAQQAEHAATVARLERERDEAVRDAENADGARISLGEQLAAICKEYGFKEPVNMSPACLIESIREACHGLDVKAITLNYDLSAARAEVERLKRDIQDRANSLIIEAAPRLIKENDDLRAQLTALRECNEKGSSEYSQLRSTYARLCATHASLCEEYERDVYETKPEEETGFAGIKWKDMASHAEHELTALRERAEGLEAEVVAKEERFIATVSHLERPDHCEIREPGNYIHLLKVFPNGDHVSMWKKTTPPVLKDGESPIYPCAEWREWMAGRPKWPIIPFTSYAAYRAAIDSARDGEGKV